MPEIHTGKIEIGSRIKESEKYYKEKGYRMPEWRVVGSRGVEGRFNTGGDLDIVANPKDLPKNANSDEIEMEIQDITGVDYYFDETYFGSLSNEYRE